MHWIMIAIIVSGGGGKISRGADGSIHLSSYETETECVKAVARRGEGKAICLQVSGIGRAPTPDELAEVEAARAVRSAEYDAEYEAEKAKRACMAKHKSWEGSFFRRASKKPDPCKS
jgi:hypothetical protein